MTLQGWHANAPTAVIYRSCATAISCAMTPQILVGLTLAGACALTTNIASILKHRGANTVPRFEIRRPLRSTRLLLGSGWFALGLGLAQFAGVLHIAALALAPMSIVQVVLAGGVVLLAALAERLLGCTVTRRQRLGLILGAAGLVLLVLSVPRLHGAHGGFALQTMVSFELVAALVGLVLALGPRGPRVAAHRGVVLGAAAGAFFGLSDIAVKAITGTIEHGAAPIAAVPWLGVAITGGLAAQVLAVRGLQEGEAVPVIALTGVTANIANIAGGVLVFRDPVAHGSLGSVGQSLAFALVVFGAALVSHATGSLGTERPASAGLT
jgi:hypothetical protein